MAKIVQFVEVTLRCDMSGGPPSEGLDYANANMRYSVCDENDNAMTKGKNDVKVDPIVGTDTVDAWFAKVAQQVKDAEGIV